MLVSVGHGHGVGGQGVVASAAVAQPEYNGAYDEEGCCRDADNQRPGQAGAQVWRSQCVLHLRVWQHGEVSTAEAVTHCVSSQANVHPSILITGLDDSQLVEVGAVRPGPHVPRG